MAEQCIFCEKPLSLFTRKELLCCSTLQPVCGDCFKEVSKLPSDERGRKALATGRAVATDLLRQNLAAQEAEARAKREKTLTDKVCLRCGAPMLSLGRQQFQLGEHTFFMGDMNHLLAGSLTLDVLRCEQCRKVEFFLPEDTKN